MADPSCPQSFSALNKFVFEKVINEDPSTHSLILLGTLPASPQQIDTRVRAIVRIEKTALKLDDAPKLLGGSGIIKRAELGGSTDIVRLVKIDYFSEMCSLISFLYSILGCTRGWEKKGKEILKSMLYLRPQMCILRRYKQIFLFIKPKPPT